MVNVWAFEYLHSLLLCVCPLAEHKFIIYFFKNYISILSPQFLLEIFSCLATKWSTMFTSKLLILSVCCLVLSTLSTAIWPEHNLQVHKAHVYWILKLPWLLQYPSKGKDMVQCSMTETEYVDRILCHLNLRFDNRPEPPFQHPGRSFPWETKQCDSPIFGASPPVLLHKNWNLNLGLPVHRYCLRPPCNTEEGCPRIVTLSWWRSLCVPETSGAMAPGRV